MIQKLSRRQMVGASASLPLAAALPAFAKPGRSRLHAGEMGAIPAALQSYIDRGDLAGIVTMTCQRGEIIQVNALGWRDIESRSPMQRDTLFRLASMTKPITTVAALMLLEEGKIRLSDPIRKWIPELANRRVLRKADGPLDDTVPAHRDITVEDLLTHRSGLALPGILVGPIQQAYDEAIGWARAWSMTTDTFLAAVSKLPLVYQPGERMQYGISTDVLGFLIERVDHKTLQAALKDRIFAPLGMADTDFWVPPAKLSRLASLYSFDEAKGGLQKAVDFTRPNIDRVPSIFFGASGLVSCAPDYMVFARMLQEGGRSGRIRLLNPETVRLMRTNRLTAAQRQFPFIGQPLFWKGMGFGLGVDVVMERTASNISNGSVGSYGWPGLWGTWWENDPVEDLTLIYMIQQSAPITPNAGAVIATGRGVKSREALPLFERMTYAAVDLPPPNKQRS